MTRLDMTIGERLKKEREKKGFSLDEVHSRLRIHQLVLSNLEENKFQALPAAIYTKGFLKRYSEFLEINADEMLSAFDTLNIQGKQQTLAVGMQNKQKLPEPPKTLMSVKHNLPPKATRSVGPTVRVSPAILKIAALAALCALGLFLAFRIVATFSTWTGSLSFAKKSAPVSAAVAPAAARALGDGSVWINSPQMRNFPALKTGTPLKLSISASTEAWVRISADGQVVFESILRPGQKKDITAQNELELKLGRPAGVSLALNGFSLGAPGNGQARHVSITREGIVQHK